MNKPAEARVSPLDWKTRTTRRVVVNTFAAETASALEGLGHALFLRALLCELKSGNQDILSSGEDHLSVKAVTDCKSLYGNVLKEFT